MQNINMEELKKIEFTYDNLQLLEIIKYFIGVVINDIEYMNEEYISGKKVFLGTAYNLGNGNCIRIEDLESLCSILDTINDIKNYNVKVV